MTIRLKFDGNVFVPDEVVDLPVGYQIDARVPEMTSAGTVKGSPEALEELIERLSEYPPLSDDDRAEWDCIMKNGKRPPSTKGRFDSGDGDGPET